MTKQEVLNGLRIERECVSRDCNRDCANCDIVQERDWLLLVYDNAIFRIVAGIILMAIYIAAYIYTRSKK